ncbi:translation elongation factor Ts [Synechococcus sp. H65.1]|uniref:translation elongation factor Ts n=1 Tax=unclassified Synechococcus TaxID=2626047 RepID=UPI0039C15D2C
MSDAKTNVKIDPQLVKQLREETGAGMMDCKKALEEAGGDREKAIVLLRQKGLAGAAKKASRITAEGVVDSYIHFGNRIGVLVEVNCETDFVARNEEFRKLVQDIAKQIAACQNVEYISIDQIPPEVVERERAIEMGKEDLASKPEHVREKIVQGRVEKRLKELSLMDQPFIKDPSITVEELVKQHIAKLGENIRVRRFARFVLGEGIEKEKVDFAAEVAAQAGLKPAEPPQAAEAATAPPAEPAADQVAVEAAGNEPVAEGKPAKKGSSKKKK